jgi:Ca2+-binding RTX toxin-like protein
VLANDGDVEGNALTIVLDAGKSALGGSLTLENGQVRYAADADAFDLMAANTSAIDHFSYHLDDGHGGVSGPISVQVTVQEAGDNISLVGGAGSDTFRAALGVDTTYDGGAGNDKIYGNSGADILLGGDGNDAIDGGAGNDVIAGGVGNDNLIGGDGNDMVDGGAGNDGLNGGNGDDYLDGGIGDDALQGGAGSDHLVGNSGNDALLGGKGNDLLEGGSGNDLFVFSALSGRDTIVDFNPGEDTILTGYAEGGALGNPTTWATTIHNAAVTTPATPWAFANFDADGNGAADSVIITGGNLGADSVVLAGWSIATLVGQHYLDPNGQAAIGGWLH